MAPVLPATKEHVRAFTAFVLEHAAESGQDGMPPHALQPDRSGEEVEAVALERWSRPLTSPRWGRAWLLWSGPLPAAGPAGFHDPGARVVGHVELQGGRIGAELHRATLGIGLLSAYRGQGHGRRLMQAAIDWARGEAGLDHVDLGVFVGNDRAKRLYVSMGFVEIGVRHDAFRVDGRSVDDIEMTLALRA
ncbi:GNAT family N-acetyltransferase [Chondromyces apiculatus]|uniref:Putative acetyltransferase n=1 Tax=Chondromyces apiculatus DSM 436 TaxID=1192034 RepID=A0A017THM3_9BACT|nr:GNAT family protein [Chondromyces apiculatus]EYF08754.1 putative acetyltransferase [Chondromyces apiculatus DSM 436]